MATYQKNGSRQLKLSERTKVKKHVKAYNQILLDMDVLADKLNYLHGTLNEDNINDYARPEYGRDLDAMEKMLVLGKIFYKNEQRDNVK